MRSTRAFNELLRDCNVQASYQDGTGQRRRASTEALIALLQSLRIPIADPSQADKILEARRDDERRRCVEPVYVAWNGKVRALDVAVPASAAGHSISYQIKTGGETVEGSCLADELPAAKKRRTPDDGVTWRSLSLPKKLSRGYHLLELEVGGQSFTSLIISAPRKAYDHDQTSSRNGRTAKGRTRPTGNGSRGAWGCFLPLYALRTEHDWGIGDFTALGEMIQWVAALGGSDVGTLPLLAAFLDEPLETSPYRPVSRLFWNELYVDVERVPELATVAEARQLVESASYRQQIQALRASDLVDYRATMRLKRDVLQRLSRWFFAERPTRFRDFELFVESNPEVQNYAAFRAIGERQRDAWPHWPPHLKEARVQAEDFDADAARYHQYVQWITNEQLTALRGKADDVGCGLYLDLPIGVDPRGYDTWANQSIFATGASVGAPPDVIFPHGQDWGLPPLDPQRTREDGHSLFRRVMANNLRFAHRLRIDHVLGFHRLFCIPPGFTADQGAYVRYPADELYAIAVLESHRYGCALVGENLGTVPAYVDRDVASHGIAGMWVAPYELEPGRRAALSAPDPQHVAMLNTHDMPPLAAWWKGDDIPERKQLGLIDDEQAEAERRQRSDARGKLAEWLQADRTAAADSPTDADIPLRPLLRNIAVSPAKMLLINLEDLWLEPQPQNIPGVADERPNWQRKARYRLEEFQQMPAVTEVLEEVSSIRKREDPVA